MKMISEIRLAKKRRRKSKPRSNAHYVRLPTPNVQYNASWNIYSPETYRYVLKRLPELEHDFVKLNELHRSGKWEEYEIQSRGMDRLIIRYKQYLKKHRVTWVFFDCNVEEYQTMLMSDGHVREPLFS